MSMCTVFVVQKGWAARFSGCLEHISGIRHKKGLIKIPQSSLVKSSKRLCIDTAKHDTVCNEPQPSTRQSKT